MNSKLPIKNTATRNYNGNSIVIGLSFDDTSNGIYGGNIVQNTWGKNFDENHFENQAVVNIKNKTSAFINEMGELIVCSDNPGTYSINSNSELIYTYNC